MWLIIILATIATLICSIILAIVFKDEDATSKYFLLIMIIFLVVASNVLTSFSVRRDIRDALIEDGVIHYEVEYKSGTVHLYHSFDDIPLDNTIEELIVD